MHPMHRMPSSMIQHCAIHHVKCIMERATCVASITSPYRIMASPPLLHVGPGGIVPAPLWQVDREEHEMAIEQAIIEKEKVQG